MTASQIPLLRRTTFVAAAVCAAAALGIDSGNLMLGPEAAAAQVTVSSDTIAAELLDQVAALARGHRTGGIAFAVVCADPIRSVGIFDTQSEAVSAARERSGPCFVRAVETREVQTDVMPTTLGKVLSQAADGYRTGEPLWIVAQSEPDYDVTGVFDDYEQAVEAQGVEPGLEVFGPYVTDMDFGRPPMFFGACHRPPTRYYLCLDSESLIPMSEIEAISVTVQAVDRAPIEWTLTPEDADAIFFNLSAVDKFLLPYYTTLFGVGYAERVRQELERLIVP
jgi:hypothetical protein